MAFVATTDVVHNVIGNKREEFGFFTLGAVQTAELRTRLYMIEHLDIDAVDTGGPPLKTYMNFSDAGVTVANGAFHIEDPELDTNINANWMYHAVGY